MAATFLFHNGFNLANYTAIAQMIYTRLQPLVIGSPAVTGRGPYLRGVSRIPNSLQQEFRNDNFNIHTLIPHFPAVAFWIGDSSVSNTETYVVYLETEIEVNILNGQGTHKSLGRLEANAPTESDDPGSDTTTQHVIEELSLAISNIPGSDSLQLNSIESMWHGPTYSITRLNYKYNHAITVCPEYGVDELTEIDVYHDVNNVPELHLQKILL